MEPRRSCVYNRTCECFLSLGVAPLETDISSPMATAGARTRYVPEESWFVRSGHESAFVVEAPSDLLFLDAGLHIVHIVEAFPTHRLARWIYGAASVLVLPLHTVYSSQSHVGDQLIISDAAEMELQFRSIYEPAAEPVGAGSTMDLEGPRSRSLHLVRWSHE